MNIARIFAAVKSGNVKPLIIENLPLMDFTISGYIKKLSSTEEGKKVVLLDTLKINETHNATVVTEATATIKDGKMIIDLKNADKYSLKSFAAKLMKDEK